ncbi:restriction endonuclease subunit S [Aliarcobacter cryaerophilus]|uniref:restriction endonuclease subunit S n=1 Tax=Aliarcobacter cryaerophilus TaxID=28198 RepID=UPI003DA28640
MSSWKECKLGEIIEIIGGGTPKTSISEYWNGNIPWLSVVDFNTGKKYVSKTEKTITEEGLKNSSTKLLQKNDIIISARGTVGALAMLDKPMTFNQSCYGIRAKENESTNDYIFYLLKDTVNQLLQISHGGVFDTITKATFDEIDISLPPLEEQKAIAEVLSSLDDKIDLLHRQNQTLESLAQTLFRQCFIEEAKESRMRKFSYWIEDTIGGDWGKENPTDDFNVAVYCIRGTDIADLNNGLPTRTPLRYIKQKKLESIEPKEGDIILEISGGTENQSTGRTIYINQQIRDFFSHPIVFSNFCRLIRIKKNEYSYFVYLYLQYLYENDEFFGLENGSSGIKNLNYKVLINDLEYQMPSENEVIKFHDNVKSYFEKINQNKKQIQTLENLRDTLLSKLLSGRIKIDYEE